MNCDLYQPSVTAAINDDTLLPFELPSVRRLADKAALDALADMADQPQTRCFRSCFPPISRDGPSARGKWRAHEALNDHKGMFSGGCDGAGYFSGP